MKPASKVAMCGICSALSVLLLFFGGVVTIFAYICPMLTGIIMIVLVTTFGYSSAWVTYFVTSVLSFFLVPDKECMLMYVLFFGYYTIIRLVLAKIKPRIVQIFVKILLFNAALAAVNLILFYVFGIPFSSAQDGAWVIIVFWIAMNVFFLLYERLLGILDVVYKQRIEKRIKRIMK